MRFAAKKPTPPSNKTNSSSELGRTFGLVAVLTFLSKFVGLVRDVVVAQAFGTTLVADAYNYAYLLTGNVLILFGGLGGPFHSSAVAVLRPKKDDPDLGKLVWKLLLVTTVILGVISLIAWLLTPILISVIAPCSVNSADRTELWAETTRQFHIMLPLILISGMVGILYGVSNVFNEVFWPSLSPAIASLAIVLAIYAFPNGGGLCLAYGTLAGAIGQLLAQLPATLKHLKPVHKHDTSDDCTDASPPVGNDQPPAEQAKQKNVGGVREYALMLCPAALSTLIGQLTVYVDSFFTSQLETGSWTAIVYSNRLVQLPLGILLTAMLVPILPRFTDHVAQGRIDDLKAEFRRAASFLWFLALPMTAILLAIPNPIIQLLFERGQFTEQSRQLVSDALFLLVPSIFFYVARDLITRVFYAHQDSRSPGWVAIIAICLKALLDWLLVGPLKVGGISLATTLITIFNLTCLTFLLRKKIGSLGLSRLFIPVSVMIGASLACGLCAYWVQTGLASFIGTPAATPHSWHRLLSLSVSIFSASALAFGVYIAICLAFKLQEPTLVWQQLRRRLLKSGS